MYGYGSDDWPALPPMSALEGRVHVADIFDLCAAVPDASVDMILCDLPYGTTACSWDTVIPFEPMWAAFRRIAKPRAAIVLTATEPFASLLRVNALDLYKYDWVWRKSTVTDFLRAKLKPLNNHELVLVFSKGTIANCSPRLMAYYPQMRPGTPYKGTGSQNTGDKRQIGWRPSHEKYVGKTREYGAERFPVSVLDVTHRSHDTEHPTQKPVTLFEYLIRTYTQPGELVFDPCVGSGTTAVAARNTGRRFIVGDQSVEYAAIAERRLAKPFTPNMFDTLEQSA